MPDNEPHIGSSSESVEDLVEKINEINATAEVKELVRILAVEFPESTRLNSFLRWCDASERRIEREDVERAAKMIGATDIFTIIEKQEIENLKKELKKVRREKENLANELKNMRDEIESLKKQLEKAGREKENLEASSKAPNVKPVVESWSDKGLYWN